MANPTAARREISAPTREKSRRFPVGSAAFRATPACCCGTARVDGHGQQQRPAPPRRRPTNQAAAPSVNTAAANSCHRPTLRNRDAPSVSNATGGRPPQRAINQQRAPGHRNAKIRADLLPQHLVATGLGSASGQKLTAERGRKPGKLDPIMAARISTRTNREPLSLGRIDSTCSRWRPFRGSWASDFRPVPSLQCDRRD